MRASELFPKEWVEEQFPKRTRATELVARTYDGLHRHPFQAFFPDRGGDLEHDEAIAETARRTGVDSERVEKIVQTAYIQGERW